MTPPPARASAGRTFVDWFFLAAIAYRFLLTIHARALIEFKDDELTWLIASYRNLHDRLALVAPPSSIGLVHPPFFVYLLSIPELWTTNPVALSLFILCLNACGLVALYVLVRRLFSRSVALATTAVFCSAPWEIVLSRKLWPADVVFPLMAFFLLCFAGYLADGRRRSLYGGFACFALLLQPHQSAWFLLAPFAIYLVFCTPRIRPADLVVALVIGVIFFGTYLFYFTVENRAALPALAQSHFGHIGAEHTPESFRVEWTLFVATGLRFDILLGANAYQAFRAAFPIAAAAERVFQAFVALAGTATVFYIFEAARWLWRSASGAGRMSASEKLIVLLIAFLVGLHVSYMALDMPVWPHYFVITYPTITLLAVLLADRIGRRWPALRVSTNGFLVAIVTANLAFATCFFQFIAQHPNDITGDYKTPYAFRQTHWKAEIRHEIDRIRRQQSSR